MPVHGCKQRHTLKQDASWRSSQEVKDWDLLEGAMLGNRLLEGNPVKGTLAHQLQSTLPHAYKPLITDSKCILDRRRES